MDFHQNFRSIPIYSINYDFNPTIPYSQKVLWTQLKYPSPTSLRIGSTVKIISSDPNFVPPPVILKVIDVVGTRVALETCERNTYTPSSCIKPFVRGPPRDQPWYSWDHAPHWGYATRDVSACPYADRNWVYGNGGPVAYLVW